MLFIRSFNVSRARPRMRAVLHTLLYARLFLRHSIPRRSLSHTWYTDLLHFARDLFIFRLTTFAVRILSIALVASLLYSI